MREDQIEALEKLFPDGVVFFHQLPNGKYEVQALNPKEDEFFERAYLEIRNSMGGWKTAHLECELCSHQWVAVQEVARRDQVLMDCECPRCHAMRGCEVSLDEPDGPDERGSPHGV